MPRGRFTASCAAGTPGGPRLATSLKGFIPLIKKPVIAVVGCALLASCQSVKPPKTPDFTLDVGGDYDSVAQCTYESIRHSQDIPVEKDAIPGKQGSQVTFDNGNYRLYELDFLPAGPGRTRVEGHFVVRPDEWRTLLEPEIRKCSTTAGPASAEAPAAGAPRS